MAVIAPRSTIKLILLQALRAIEYVDLSVSAITKPVVHDGQDHLFSESRTLDDNSDVPVSQCAYFRMVLEGDYTQIDLQDLPGLAGRVSALGEKVRAIIFSAPSTNNGPITVSPGVVHGYSLLGSSFSFEVREKQVIGPLWLDDEGPVVTDLQRYIAFSRLGTGSGTGTGTGFEDDVIDGYLDIGIVTG